MDQQSAAPVKRSGPGHGQPATLAFLSVVVFAWGGNYTWVKLALEDNGPWVFNALRYGCAVVLLGAVLSIRTQSTGILPLRGERLMMSVIGVLQIAVMTGATNIALTMIEASRTVLIAYSMPIWSMLLSRALLSERVTVRMAAGLLLGLTGLALLCAPWAMDWTSRSAVLGSGIALSGTLAWALASVLYKSRRWRSRFWTQIFGQLLAASAILVPAGILLEARPLMYTTSFAAIICWNAIVPTILGFYCWAQVLDRLPVTKASQFLLFSPIVGVLLSAAVLDERLTPSLLASGVLILAGALLSYLEHGPKTRNQEARKSEP